MTNNVKKATIWGYARVSTAEQHEDRQIAELKQHGAVKVFLDKKSGKNKEERTELAKLLNIVETGDTIILTEFDRLGRNMSETNETLQILQKKKVHFIALNMPDFSNVEDESLRLMMENMVINLYNYISESFRKDLLEKQAKGIEIAKKKGSYKGKKPLYDKYSKDPKKRMVYDNIVTDLENGVSIAEISRNYEINRKTIYRIRERNDNYKILNKEEE